MGNRAKPLVIVNSIGARSTELPFREFPQGRDLEKVMKHLSARVSEKLWIARRETLLVLRILKTLK